MFIVQCSLSLLFFETVQLIIAERRIFWKKGVKQREKKCKVWPISIRCTRHLLPKKHSWIGSRMKISHFSKEFTFWLSSRRGSKVLLHGESTQTVQSATLCGNSKIQTNSWIYLTATLFSKFIKDYHEFTIFRKNIDKQQKSADFFLISENFENLILAQGDYIDQCTKAF